MSSSIQRGDFQEAPLTHLLIYNVNKQRKRARCPKKCVISEAPEKKNGVWEEDELRRRTHLAYYYLPLPLLQNKHRIEFRGPVFEWLLLQKKDAERRSPSTSPLSFSRGSAAYTYVWAIVFVGSGNLLRNGIRLDRQEVKIYGAPFSFSEVAVCTISQIKKVSDFPPLSRRKKVHATSLRPTQS